MEDNKYNQPIGERTVIIKDAGLRKLKGFIQIPRLVLLHPEISYGAKVVYGVLLHYAWQDDFCFPAQDSLAKDMLCTDRQIRRYLDELKTSKLVSWKQRGLTQPNIYSILSIPEKEISTLIEHKSAQKAGKKGIKPDRTYMSGQERTHKSVPDRTQVSGQERTRTSDNIEAVDLDSEITVNGYSPTEQPTTPTTNNDERNDAPTPPKNEPPPKPKPTIKKKSNNPIRDLPKIEQDPERVMAIANEIISKIGDSDTSLNNWRQAAWHVPYNVISENLTEIRLNGATNPPALLNYRLTEYAKKRLQANIQQLQKQAANTIGNIGQLRDQKASPQLPRRTKNDDLSVQTSAFNVARDVANGAQSDA